jgi:hypothetical protein
MKIRDALKKRKKGEAVSSKQAEMFDQTPKTLAYWMFLEKGDVKYKLDWLTKIHSVEDWSVHKKGDWKE